MKQKWRFSPRSELLVKDQTMDQQLQSMRQTEVCGGNDLGIQHLTSEASRQNIWHAAMSPGAEETVLFPTVPYHQQRSVAVRTEAGAAKLCLEVTRGGGGGMPKSYISLPKPPGHPGTKTRNPRLPRMQPWKTPKRHSGTAPVPVTL